VDSGPSNYSVFTVQATTPSKPTRQLPSNNSTFTDTTPDLNWSSESNATSYKLWLIDTNLNQYKYNGTSVSSSNKTTAELNAGHTYRWWVSACNGSNCSSVDSGPSNYSVFTVQATQADDNKPTITITSEPVVSADGNTLNASISASDDNDIDRISAKIYVAGNTAGNEVFYSGAVSKSGKNITHNWVIDISQHADRDYEIMFFVADEPINSGASSQITGVIGSYTKSSVSDSPPSITITSDPVVSADGNTLNASISASDDNDIDRISAKIYVAGNTTGNEVFYSGAVSKSGKNITHNWVINISQLPLGNYEIIFSVIDDEGLVTDKVKPFSKLAVNLPIVTNPTITEAIAENEFTFTVTLSAPLEAGQGVFINFDNQQGDWFTQTDAGGHIQLTHQGGNVYSYTRVLNKPGIRSVRAGVFALNGAGNADDVLLGSYSSGSSCTLADCLAAVTRTDSYGNPAGSQLFKQVDVANGNLYLAMTDMSVPGKGPSFAFSRAYNSLAAKKWSFGYEMKARFLNVLDIDDITVLSTDRRIEIGPREDGSLLHYFKDLDGLWYTFTAGNFNQLIEKGDGSFTLYSQGNRLYNFADPHPSNGVNAGQLQSIQDRSDNALSFNYTAGDLTSVTDANSRTYIIKRDGSNRIQRVTDFTGRYVDYIYNSNSMLTQVRNMRGGFDKFNYAGTSGDDRYRIQSINDPRGGVPITIAYNGSGQVSSLTDAYARTTSFVYAVLNTSITTLNGREATGIAQPAVGGVNHNLVFVLNDARTRVEDRLDAQNAGDYRTKKDYQTITSRAELAEQSLVTRMVEPNNINIDKGTDITYDATAKGRPTDITDADGNISTASYSAVEAQTNLNVVATTKQAGVSSSTTYSTFTTTGQATAIVDPRGFSRARAYDGNDWLTQSTDARNNATNYTYDVYGQVLTITDSASNQTTRSYDTLGRVTTETSPLGLVTSYTYDAHGNILTQREFKSGTGINYTTQYSYDANDNLVQTIDPKGYVTNSIYDDLNRKISDSYTVNAVAHTRSYAYDELGQLKSTTNERGNTSSTYYDERSQVASKVDPLGNTTVTYGYDANGNITTVTDAQNRTTTTTYDVINRKTRVEDGKGNSQTWRYNTAGQVAAYTDARGEVTGYQYDAMGNVTQLTDSRGGVTANTYDGNGNVLTVSDPKGQVTTYTYDNLDRRTRTTLNNGEFWAYTYDVNGNLLTETTPTGEQTLNVYDALNRMTQLTEKAAGGSVTRQISYSYDANSNVSSETSGGKTISYTYDEVNRVNSVTDQYAKTISYGYDKAGNRTTLTYPGNKVISYAFDANDRLDTLTDWLNKTTDYTRNNAGQITQVINGNGTKTQYGYETETGRLTTLKNQKADGSVISSHVMTLDGAGNITKSIMDLPLPPAFPVATGNMAYDSSNRILSAAGSNYTHDKTGRIIKQDAAGVQTIYNFDINDHITSIIKAGVTQSSYNYDLNNNRISQTQNSVETRYVIDQLASLPNVVAETDDQGNIQTYYLYGDGLVSQIDAAGDSHYYHFDPTGNTLALSDSSGAVSDTYAYSPYGFTSSTGATQNPFRFVGKYGVMDDGNGLHYMRARFYSEEIKRFVSLDALHGDIMNSQALNRYAYVIGNPIMGIDPSGYENKLLDQTNTYLKRFSASTNLMKRISRIKKINKLFKIKKLKKLIKIKKLRKALKIKKLNKRLGKISIALDLYSSAGKIRDGQGSYSGQARNIAFSMATSSVDVIGLASTLLDLGANTVGIDSNVSGVIGTLQEAAFDPTSMDYITTKSIEKMESDGTLQCVVDRTVCDMNMFEHFIFTVGRAVTQE
jgi:RHS repeat-associated protein